MANDHQKESNHWSAFAKGLTELGSHVHAMHKEAGMKGECKAGDACDKLAASAQSHADYHAGAAEECMKAIDAVDLNKNRGAELEPSPISRVTPTAPVRAVLRNGMQPLPAESSELSREIFGTHEN